MAFGLYSIYIGLYYCYIILIWFFGIIYGFLFLFEYLPREFSLDYIKVLIVHKQD